MSKPYINEKSSSLNSEINIACDIYENMKKNGLVDFAILDIDFNFTSNAKEKLKALQEKLFEEFEIKIEYLKKISLLKSEYELSLTLLKIPMTEDLLVYLIVYLYRRAHDFDCTLGDWGALVDNDNLFDVDQADPKALMSSGYEFYKSHRHYRAFSNFYLAAARQKNPEALFNLGCLKYDWNIIRDAIVDFDKAIEIYPQNPLPYLNRGVAYYDLGEYEKAIADYEFVAKNEPDNPDPFLNIANAYVQLKDKEKAIQYYDRAISMGSQDAKKAKENGLQQLA